MPKCTSDKKQVSDRHLPRVSDHHLTLNFRSALKDYLYALQADRQAERTIENKRNILELVANYAEEHQWPQVGGITTRHLRQFLADIQQRPKWFGRQVRDEL